MRTPLLRCPFGIAGLLLMPGLSIAAQVQRTAPIVPLAAVNATLKEEFTRLLSARELGNGRVLLTDEKDGRLVVADFQNGLVRSLGRAGEGPGEFRAVGRLWDVGGDSTFMSVPYARRWLLLHRDSVVSTFTGQLPVILKVGSSIIRGADARGNVLTIPPMVRTPGKPIIMPDSLAYVRTNRASLQTDTVFKTINSDKDIIVSAARATGAPPPPEKRLYHVSLKARDQIAMFPDGVVAVLRGNPFRVDWCLVPEKPCNVGALLQREATAWSAADKRAYLKSMNALAAWPPTDDVNQTTGWPEQMPPFATPGGPDEANFWAISSGNVVLERVPNANTALIVYDVIDRKSRVVARVSVPPGHRVLGFGARSVFTVNVDENGVQRLQRHAWSY